MKRVLLGFPMLAVTFAAGYLLSTAFGRSFVTVTSREIISTLRPEGPANSPPQSNAKKALDSRPEFINLPDDFEMFTAPGNNLIHAFDTDVEYRESEVVAKSGETWLTLFKRGGKYIFQRSRTTVKSLSTISYPGGESDARLNFDKPGPIIAVKTIRDLKPGWVNILYHGPSEDEIHTRGLSREQMKTGYRREFNLNDSWYTLRVSHGLTKNQTQVGALVLEHDDLSQVVALNYMDPGYDSIIGNLYLVGDLDNDGRLDLYFDYFNEKGAFVITLYLSSAAKRGELVRAVASFSTAGC